MTLWVSSNFRISGNNLVTVSSRKYCSRKKSGPDSPNGSRNTAEEWCKQDPSMRHSEGCFATANAIPKLGSRPPRAPPPARFGREGSTHQSSSTTLTSRKKVFLLTRFLNVSRQWQNFSYVERESQGAVTAQAGHTTDPSNFTPRRQNPHSDVELQESRAKTAVFFPAKLWCFPKAQWGCVCVYSQGSVCAYRNSFETGLPGRGCGLYPAWCPGMRAV